MMMSTYMHPRLRWLNGKLCAPSMLKSILTRSNMVLHHIKDKDIVWLSEYFAFFTEDGWIIPDWVYLLRDRT